MPNMHSTGSWDYSEYDDMNTQELERILDQYFLFPEEAEDKKLMVYIMEVLAERDREIIDANAPNPNPSWDDFQKTLPNIAEVAQIPLGRSKVLDASVMEKASSMKKLHRISGIAAIFVCVLLVGTITAYAAGINIFQAVAQWTDDTFYFKPTVEENIEKQIPEQLLPLYEELKLHDMIPLIPTYLPKGYETKSIDSILDSSETIVSCFLSGEDGPIIIEYIFYNTASAYTQYEKDAGDPEEINVEGITIYLFSNSNTYTATWLDGNIESSIIANSKAELIKIVKSLK